MKFDFSHRCALVAAVLLAATLPSRSMADDTWPQKQIRLVVPFSAGGPSDVLARAFSRSLSEVVAQPVVVDNRGGAGGAIGIDLVSKAAPDGYTLGLAHTGTTSINPHVMAKYPYNPLT